MLDSHCWLTILKSSWSRLALGQLTKKINEKRLKIYCSYLKMLNPQNSTTPWHVSYDSMVPTKSLFHAHFRTCAFHSIFLTNTNARWRTPRCNSKSKSCCSQRALELWMIEPSSSPWTKQVYLRPSMCSVRTGCCCLVIPAINMLLLLLHCSTATNIRSSSASRRVTSFVFYPSNNMTLCR